MSTSVVKWCKGVSNRVPISIRRCIDQMQFADCMALSFITFFPYSLGSVLYHCMYGCMFCMRLIL